MNPQQIWRVVSIISSLERRQIITLVQINCAILHLYFSLSSFPTLSSDCWFETFLPLFVFSLTAPVCCFVTGSGCVGVSCLCNGGGKIFFGSYLVMDLFRSWFFKCWWCIAGLLSRLRLWALCCFGLLHFPSVRDGLQLNIVLGMENDTKVVCSLLDVYISVCFGHEFQFGLLWH